MTCLGSGNICANYRPAVRRAEAEGGVLARTMVMKPKILLLDELVVWTG